MVVTALDFSLPEKGGLASIVYIPEGTHTITPCVNGEPMEVMIKMEAASGPEVAKIFQANLDKRLQANVRPFFDFDHQDTGPAAALPKRFYYKNGQGLMAEIEWTGAGRKSIESKDYSYFSPTFLIDDAGKPSGIPARGPLGALVNEPAFRDIPRIAASEAARSEKKSTTEKNPSVMSKLIFAALSVSAAHVDAESLAVSKIESMKNENSKMTEQLADAEKVVADLKEKMKMAAKEAQEAKESAAENVITTAVADGRIAAKDESNKKFWKDMIVEKGELAIKALDSLPKLNPGISQTQVTAASGGKINQSGDFLSEVKRVVEAKEAANEDEAMSLVSARSPELYQAYVDQIGS